MASVSITVEAEVEIARAFSDLGNYESPTVPVLMLHWSPRTMENRRGPDGETIWEQIDDSHWSADVAGWTDTPERKIAENTMLVQGFRVLLDSRAQAAQGTLVVDAVARVLRVQLRGP